MTRNWFFDVLLGIFIALASYFFSKYLVYVLGEPDPQMFIYGFILLYSTISFFAGVYRAILFGIVFSVSVIVLGVLANEFTSVFAVLISFLFIPLGISLSKRF